MSGHNATTLLLSNPVRTSGFIYDTQHNLKDMWFTIHVSHEMSDRVSDDFVEDIARRYGRDSNAYRIRCLGEFPRADDDTVIPFELIESARRRDIRTNKIVPTVWGVDVGRFGDDRSVLVQRRGRVVLDNILWWQGEDTMQSAGRVKRLWDDTQPSERPEEILIDVIGIGAGVVDRLRELKLPARGINVGEASLEREKYTQLRSELWFKGQEWLAGKDVKLPEGTDNRENSAEMLANELAVPKYKFTSSGRIQVETKDDMKKRGHKSPNFADAFLLTLASTSTTLMHGSKQGTTWGKAIQRKRKGIV